MSEQSTNATTPGNPLKIVDISEINKKCGEELVDAASTQGFLFVKGHGFTAKEVDALFNASKKFFALPKEQKQKLPISENNIGYEFAKEQLDTESRAPDPKESLNMDPRDIPLLFDDDDAANEVIKSAAAKLQELSIKIHRGFALGLHIGEEAGGAEYFTQKYDPKKESGLIFRFLHYPGQGSLDPSQQIRAGAHTDYGSVTLLFQQRGQEGLEIYSPVAKEWQPVPYVDADNEEEAPPIIVNNGDQLSYWTGGLLRLTIHRVKFPPHIQKLGGDRYLIVFFSHPADDTLLEAIPSDIVKPQRREPGEEPITAKQHLQKRLAATYGWSY